MKTGRPATGQGKTVYVKQEFLPVLNALNRGGEDAEVLLEMAIYLNQKNPTNQDGRRERQNKSRRAADDSD